MKINKKLILLAIALNPIAIIANNETCNCDSVDVLAYSNIDGSGGLKLAINCCGTDQWEPLGDDFNFVSSDFGPWGSYKKMFAPELHQNSQNEWVATWIADVEDGVIATAVSPDLISWKPQIYNSNITPRLVSNQYFVNGRAVSGNIVKMPSTKIAQLKSHIDKRKALDEKYAERMEDDASRFAGIYNANYKIKAEPKGQKDISDKLIGIFFEDINYGADGGLYAELIQNRDFEYNPADRNGDENWNAMKAWKITTPEKGEFTIETTEPIHPNNPHYLALTAKYSGYKLTNSGFDRIAVKKGGKYDFSIAAKSTSETQLTVSLIDDNGRNIASAKIKVNDPEWTYYNATLTSNETIDKCKLEISVETPSEIDIDMVSLFPQDTFKGRKNGLRKDLAETLEALDPKFVRFPGGCVAHGDGIDNIYDWKGSIGPLEARKPLRNLWGYHQTRGLGYHEYFLFCEDIGAEPLPVLAAGVPCQNTGNAAHHSHDALTTRGQQCGIPMDEMDAYIQDILDLIEYANGDVNTVWGTKRAEAGHPEPFNLKYIGIGNEDMITEVFIPRFTMIYNAVREAHPEIEVVGTVGPFYEGADYDAGWNLANELNIPLVDEHYYVSPGWMIYNQDYYNDYKRNATKVYLGEYAAHVPGRSSNMETALAEALYLTSVERNADVVDMTSYAPLLAKEGHTQWRPDLIYFNNTEVKPTTDYYVQQLYGLNSGSKYIPTTTTLDIDNEKANVRVGSSIVYDKATGDYIIKLVNILPVEVNADIDLNGLNISKKAKATCTVLNGCPELTNVKPIKTSLNVKSLKKFDYKMLPYSFTVIRIHAK